MTSFIDHSNLLNLAWKTVRPYLIELPAVFIEDHKLLKETRYVADTLTAFELFLDYASKIEVNPSAKDILSGTSVASVICRTPRFEKIPEQRRLNEIYTVTNILSQFMSLFSTRDEALKNEYRQVLSDEFYDYKIINFYHAAAHDLMFESFLEMIVYFDNLCAKFTFDTVLTKGILEIFCMMMPSAISRHYNTSFIMTPSFTYKGLLPVFAAKESLSGNVHLFCSAAVNRCCSKIESDVIYNDEAPLYIDFILKQLVDQLSRPVSEMFSDSSIFNNDIIGLNVLHPAKNVFTLTKSFSLGNDRIKFYSYNNDLENYLLSVSFANNPLSYYVVGEGLKELNKAPMDLVILDRFSLSKNGTVSELNEKENDLVDGLLKNLKLIIE